MAEIEAEVQKKAKTGVIGCLETARLSKNVKKGKKSSENVKQLVSSDVVETPSSFEDEYIKREALDDEDVAETFSALSEIIEDPIIPKNESEEAVNDNEYKSIKLESVEE